MVGTEVTGTLARDWQLYRREMLPPDAPEDALEPLQAAFYAGALAVWAYQSAALQAINLEIEHFSRSECDRIGCHCHRQE